MFRIAKHITYTGKTARCLPSNRAGAEADGHLFDFTKKHWCNLDTAKRYLSDTFVDYIVETKDYYHLESEQVSLLAEDGWFAHRNDEYRAIADNNNIYLTISPFGASDLCNGLDIGPNKVFKEQMTDKFRNFLAEEYVRQNTLGISDRDIKYDFTLGNIKNRHLTWMIESYQYLVDNPEISINSMRKSMCLPFYDEQKERERYGLSS